MEARTTGLGPWTVWVAGIALAWATLGMIVAGLWWMLYWPVMLGGAVLYSILEDRRKPNTHFSNHRPRLAPRTSGATKREANTL
jgi:hypothetical protein